MATYTCQIGPPDPEIAALRARVAEAQRLLESIHWNRLQLFSDYDDKKWLQDRNSWIEQGLGRATESAGGVRTFVDPANPANEVSICPTCHCDDFDCRCERARSRQEPVRD